MNKKTKIVVNTPQGTILTYVVDSYELRESFVFLYDENKTLKGFPASWCELTGVQ